MSLGKKTICRLRAIRAAVVECENVNKVPIKLDLVKVSNNSHR